MENQKQAKEILVLSKEQKMHTRSFAALPETA
jgi:hypothetical protein